MEFRVLNLLVVLVSMCSESPFLSVADKSHILFLMADDWGWANVGYHHDPPSNEVVTLNFDSLVKEGLELDQHYAFWFCSPSRCSLPSGQLPIHVNDVNAPVSDHNPQDPVSGFAGFHGK